jgi:mono/diheme cytochrome c family protein
VLTTFRLLIATLIVLCGFPSPSDEQDNGAVAATGAAAIGRGKYIVEGVAVCWRCHTPRDQDGSPDQQRWLLGGPVPVESARPTDEWAEVAPRLAGLPPGTDEQFIRLMMTGISRTGRPPRPPMPQFRLTRTDAEAVLAYLKSIKTTE